MNAQTALPGSGDSVRQARVPLDRSERAEVFSERATIKCIPSDLYDVVADSYASYRRPDPRLARAIANALGDASSVLNVGAGTGSYEPSDRRVVAVDRSLPMLRARQPSAPPAVRAVAEALPFSAGAFDAALAVLTLHHWSDHLLSHKELDLGYRLVVASPR